MGVKIISIVERRRIDLDFLKGKKLAVDAYNWIYQFLSIIRQSDGTPLMDSEGNITSHLSGLFYRTTKLMIAGIRPIYVFDGKPPDFKYVIEGRIEKKEEARTAWREALKKGDITAARTAAQATSRLTHEMKQESKELLSYLGLPVVQAPSEGEAQCAHMCKQKQVYSTASQDADVLLFGSPRMVRNLSITGRRKLPGKNIYIDVVPELIELEELLKSTGLTQKQLIMVGMLIGTDFNSGIRGYGPKKSLKLVKQEKTLSKVLKKIEWVGPNPKKIMNFFLSPPTEDVKIKFSSIKKDKIKELLVEKHEFSRGRIEKILKELVAKQKSSLGRWM